MSAQYLFEWIYHSIFAYLYCCCWQFKFIPVFHGVKHYCKCSFKPLCSCVNASLGLNFGVEFLVLFAPLNLIDIVKMIFKVIVIINTPINSVWNPQPWFLSPAVSVSKLCNISKSGGCELVSHYSFNLHCPEEQRLCVFIGLSAI